MLMGTVFIIQPHSIKYVNVAIKITMNNQFNQFSLTHALLDNLDELKFHSMTPIQAQSLGYILENKDVIGQAKTGSGKTAAFGLGILNS